MVPYGQQQCIPSNVWHPHGLEVRSYNGDDVRTSAVVVGCFMWLTATAVRARPVNLRQTLVGTVRDPGRDKFIINV